MSGRPNIFSPEGVNAARKADDGVTLIAYTAINGAGKRIASVYDCNFTHVTIDGVRYQSDNFGRPQSEWTHEPTGETRFTEVSDGL